LRVRLTSEEFEYLQSGRLLVESTADILARGVHLDTGDYILDVSTDQADRLRDAAGEALQRLGFDGNYKPTKEGTLLEGLVDRFFVR
jgi:hypothetical protein